MNQIHDINAWSLYWSEDRLYSCVAHSSDEDQKVLDTLWHGFSQALDPKSRLLDLATGNGAVAHAMLSVNKDLQIDAIDKASIDPNKSLKDAGDLSGVNFHSDVDLFDLSYEASEFDAITSQFGIEYAGLIEASIHVMSYLKIGGRFQFVIHHANSDIIESSKKKISELEQLTKKSGVLDTLIAVLGGKAEFAQLESEGQKYLMQEQPRSEQISGQVFAGIERIINNFAINPQSSLELGVSMDLRIRSELMRLQQLIKAGQTEAAMTSWLEKVSTQGLDASFSPIYLDPVKQNYLLGWLAVGVRKK